MPSAPRLHRRSPGTLGLALLAGGGLPALAFALRHPARCSALVPTVPGARLLSRATGGHIRVGHDAELCAEVGRFPRSMT